MYNHIQTIEQLGKIWGSYNWGHNFNSHVEQWLIETKIKIVYDYDAAYWGGEGYQATIDDYDLDCKVGHGKTANEAIEELLMAMEG